jgi:hypothetical protein
MFLIDKLFLTTRGSVVIMPLTSVHISISSAFNAAAKIDAV